MKPSDPREAVAPSPGPGVPFPPTTAKAVPSAVQSLSFQSLQGVPLPPTSSVLPNNKINHNKIIVRGSTNHFNAAGGRRPQNRRIHGNFIGQGRNNNGHYGPKIQGGMTPPPPPPPPNGMRNNNMNRQSNAPPPHIRNFGGNGNQMIGRENNNAMVRNQQMRGGVVPFQGDSRRNSNMNVSGRANDFPPPGVERMRNDGRMPPQHHNFGPRRSPGVPPPPPPTKNGFQGLQTATPHGGVPPPPPLPAPQHGRLPTKNVIGPPSNISDNMRQPLIQQQGHPISIRQNGNNMILPPPPPPPKQDARHHGTGRNDSNFMQVGISPPPIPPPRQQQPFHPVQHLQDRQHQQQLMPPMNNSAKPLQQQQFPPMQAQQPLGNNNINNSQPQQPPHHQHPISHQEIPFQKQQSHLGLSQAHPPPRQQGIQGSPPQQSLPVNRTPPHVGMTPKTTPTHTDNTIVSNSTYSSSQRPGVTPMSSVQIPHEGQSIVTTTTPLKQQQVHGVQQGSVSQPKSAMNTKDKDSALNWSTHKSPTGANYYYNSVTKVSTYDRPSCLQAENFNNHEEKGFAAQSQSPSGKSTSGNKDQVTTTGGGKQKWTEYKDQATGKTYYYDGVTTTWDKPADFESSLNKNSNNETRKTSRSNTSATTDESVPRKKRKDGKSHQERSIYSNKAEAVAAFKGLLLAKDVSPTLKWNDVVRLCSSDSRWDACSTMGERKQALAEFQTRRANEIREQKRQEKVRAKEAFTSLLQEVLPNVRAFNASANTGFGEIRDSLSKDDRFYAVEEEEKREELFYDFVEELRKREERQRRGRKRDGKEAFIAFLKYREETGGLTFASTWTSFLASLDEKDKTDKRFIVSPAMSDSDRQLYFADYVIELQAAEDEKRRRIRDARRRAEKAQRDAYRETLRVMAVEGKILPSSRWRNFEDHISSKVSFSPVSEQDRDAPRDMFEDFVEDWADSYRRDKVFLSRLVSSSKNLTVNADTQLEGFKKAILEEAAYSPDVYSDVRRIINREEPISNIKLFLDELVLKAKKDNENTISFGRRRGVGNRNDSSSDEDGEVQEDTQIVVKKD